MSKTYYPQHPWGDGPHLRPPTLTVGKLLEQLRELDPDLPVVFRSPFSGAFGAGMHYSIEAATHHRLAAETRHNPARILFDEEEGKDVPQEAYDDHLPAWEGVVLG